MHALIHPFVQICLLRMRPQDLPSSQFLLGLSLAAYAITMVISLSVLGMPVTTSLLAGVLAVALLAALSTALLYATNYRQRLTQTLTALAGCGAVLNAATTPFALFMQPSGNAVGLGVAAALGFSLLVLWSFAITAHILRHALSASFWMGLALAIAFNLVSKQVFDLLFEMQVGVQ